ncbi:putative insecticidal toxin complex protein [Yersinia enterocolitica (type O:9) str. YE212/02]|uniref:RHS repeat domain-containing protein n=2 Tax=Yersinia enterocolitica TaxID=630 RepID=UPI000327EBD9|nr:RHS repeat domain-containing protein [Yersinia enterocolitica]CCV28351.1 putative insecticidal toxin complex protein [Yersinia enterocolitica (type O:9) str. YE212/02]
MKNNNSTIAAHNNTPTLAISDNRGLAIRALAYNRIHTSDAPEELITRNRYNAVGQLIASRDARLDSDNFRYQYPLGGAALRTDGVDNGTSMQLTNIEGRPVMSLDAKGTRSWVTYEPELGRPLAHQQQPEGGQKTVTDRFFYGENSAGHKAANINGQCIRHYDTAGLQQVDSLSISGVALQQQRQLLTDTLGPVNWFGEEQSWASRLRRESFVTRCTTDILGQLITQTDAKGHTQRMAYNRAGQLSGSWLTIKNGAEQVMVKSLDYSAAGQKLREESGNGVVTEYRYEAETQRLIGIKTTRPAIKEQPTLLQDLRYDYDPVGNILAIHNDAEATRFFRNQKIVPETTYRYDALYQLTEATGRESDSNRAQNASLPALSSLTDGNQYVNYTRRYSYDRAGNLLKIQHSGASQYSTNITISNISNHGIQQQDGLTAADIRCQFDAAGNQQQLQPGQPLQWDARHQLQQVTTVKRGAENTPNDDYEHYLYASDGMRVVKQSIQHTNNIRQISRVTYLPGLELRTQHNDSELMEDFQVITLGASGRAQVRVLLWEKGLPAGIDNGQLRYSFDNQIGSSLLELDNNGDIISQEEYYPFGGTALFAARNTIEAKYKTVRYSGKERDATGLYYYGFRYYMPWLGRWLNADPAGTIDGLNLYRMVRNNPISLMDEDGRMPVRKRSGGFSLLNNIEKHKNVRDSDVTNLGLHNIEYNALRSLAKEKGWDINVRTGNQARVQYVGLKGYRPKPAGVYQKTNKEGDYQGLVLYKEHEYQKGLIDVEHINNPAKNAMDSIKVLGQEGFHLQKSVIGGNTYYLLVDKFENKVYGDIDLHSVLDKNGREVSPDEWVTALNTTLEKQNYMEKNLCMAIIS